VRLVDQAAEFLPLGLGHGAGAVPRELRGPGVANERHWRLASRRADIGNPTIDAAEGVGVGNDQVNEAIAADDGDHGRNRGTTVAGIARREQLPVLFKLPGEHGISRFAVTLEVDQQRY
jgi:hypothetical protein